MKLHGIFVTLLCIAITVRFEREAYPVANKNSPVQPVLLLSGAASFPISVRVFEVDGTATGMCSYGSHSTIVGIDKMVAIVL